MKDSCKEQFNKCKSCTKTKDCMIQAVFRHDIRTATEINLQKELKQTKAELDGYKELLMKMAGKTIYIQDDEDIPAIFKDLKDEQIRLLKEEVKFLKECRCPHCEPRQCFNHDKTPVEVYIEPFCRIKNEHQKRGDALNKIILSSPKFNIDACRTLTAAEIELKASSLYATHIEDIRQMAIQALEVKK